MTDLHDVQKECLKRSIDQPGFGLLMEMGLGKTLAALEEFRRHTENKEVSRMVVLCPNTFKSGWVKEIKKHGFDFDALIFEARSDYIAKQWINKKFTKPPILIVNYEAIRRSHVQDLIQAFISKSARGASIYADESILISTHDSQQTKAAISIAKLFKYRRILSGKPMKQGPHDYWSQLRFIGAINGINYYQWRYTFCVLGGFKGKQVIGIQNAEKLAAILEPLTFIAKKDEWIDLPPKMYSIEHYEMSPYQQEKFDEMFEEFCVWLESEKVITVDAAITKYGKLAQIQSGFIIDEESKAHDFPGENPRLDRLKEALEYEVAGKAAIVYHYRHSGTKLKAALAKYNPAQITGGMRPGDIDAEKDKFNLRSDCRVILLQDDASKYGHTLLGGDNIQDRCSTMLFYENTYSLDTRSQVEDRIHRMGQKSNVCLYVDFAGSLIDERMAEALQRKEDIYQTIVKAVTSLRDSRSGSSIQAQAS